MRGYKILEVGAQGPRVGGNLASWEWGVFGGVLWTVRGEGGE